jgi:CheY-like chemotaxis protein
MADTASAQRPESSAVLRQILLCEDHDDTRIMLGLVLRRRGYDVTAVATKAEAIIACQHRSFDLLISDIQLPDGSGLDLMRELSKICHVKGIAYTGNGNEQDMADIRAAGFSAHLLKPADLNNIFETVERLFADSGAGKAI